MRNAPHDSAAVFGFKKIENSALFNQITNPVIAIIFSILSEDNDIRLFLVLEFPGIGRIMKFAKRDVAESESNAGNISNRTLKILLANSIDIFLS